MWYQPGLVPLSFRSRHAMLTMHVWFLHRRLILDPTQPTFSLGVQEELFDFLWNDTKARIRAEPVNELTVYSHLKTVQQYTLLHMTHYDHAMTLLENNTNGGDSKQSCLEECLKAIWIHVFNQNPQVENELLQTMGVYLEYQLENIVYRLPDEYFFQGQIGWGNVPTFASHVLQNKTWVNKEEEDKWKLYYDLPQDWKRVYTDAGHSYYWNSVTQQTQWNRPTLKE
jgi:cytochrome b pre-mRNA-processing protein 3